MQPQLVLVIMNLIHLLYKKDILSEESILEWYKNPRSDSIEEIRKKVI